MQTSYHIRVIPSLVGNERINGILFGPDGISVTAVDQARIEQFAGQGNIAELIEARSPADVARIAELEAAVESLRAEADNYDRQALALRAELTKAQEAKPKR